MFDIQQQTKTITNNNPTTTITTTLNRQNHWYDVSPDVQQSCCETTISTTCQVYFDVMRHPRSRTCQVCGNNDNPATSTTMRHQQQHSGSELKTPLVGHLRLDFTTTTHRQYNNNATTIKQHNNKQQQQPSNTNND